MKDTKDVTAVVFDHGMFMPLAVRLAKEFKQVYYHTPCEKGFPDVKEWVLGDGSSVIHRCDYPLDTSFLQEVDLFVFPDIQHGRLQRYLEDMGFPVWGSRRADELESMKGVWYRKLKELGLKVPKHEVVKGLDNLRSVLMDRDNLYIKINRYRKTMDTWHHIDWAQSRLIVDDLAKKLGPMQDFINFYVLDPIDTDLEGGLDTFCIDGQWPKDVVMGYECKNKAYLATVLPFKEAPEEFRFANEAIAETLREYRYRNFFSTEVRVSGDDRYFIDPTCFSDDTEVLTNHGWKLFKDLDSEESVCTLNPTTKAIEYHVPEAHIAYHYQGDMISITNRKKDLELLVTPNHRVWGYTPWNVFKDVAADAIPCSFYIPRTGTWNGIEMESFTLPEYNHSWHSGKGKGIDKSVHRDAITIDGDVWLKFLALYLSEGSSRQWQVSISQTKYNSQMLDILQQTGFDWRTEPRGFRCSNRQLACYLEQFGNRYQKYIPEYVKQCSARQIDLFLSTYCLGDGHVKAGNRLITTPSKRTADDIQELFLKSGSVASVIKKKFIGKMCTVGKKHYACKHDSFVIKERSKSHRFYVEGWGNSRHSQYLSRVPYSGMVYDVTVKNHILFVRRNGKPCWSGNCRMPSPAGECQLDLYDNLGDIVWHGANCDLVDPVIHAPFAGESFINHTGDQKEWRALRVPESVKENVKLYANVEIDGVNYFPPGDEETLGAITATGETLEDVISTIGEVSEELKENAIEVDMAPFAELLKEIRSAEDEGIEFSEQEVPKPEVVVKGS